MKLKLKRYLGDGVHAGFDGCQIWIWTDCNVNDAPKVNFIAFEPDVMESLERYTADLKSLCSGANLDDEILNREQI